MASSIAHYAITHLVSFFFVSQSFFIHKEENLLFQYIVSFGLYCGILLYILPGLETKGGSLKWELICKKCKPV